jgi:hypothetical protein
LAYVAPEFRCDNPGGLRVKALNPEVRGMTGIENTNFGFLGCRFALTGLSLPKIRNRFG